MNEKSMSTIFYGYIRAKLKTVLLLLAYVMIFVVVFSLYSVKVELEPVVYAFVLSLVFTTFLVIADFIKFYRKIDDLSILRKSINTNISELPTSSDLVECEYQTLLHTLFEFKNNLTLQADRKETDMIDYYTLWAHQIKTPIAAIRLLLQSQSSSELKGDLMMQLGTIEQYVEMVLGYLRIESPSKDLSIKKFELIKLVKQAVRKYSNFFIKKKIQLELKESECTVLTDEKWVLFVVEQILFNALKYTNDGKITIEVNAQKVLIIKDTGIGIAEEDLPRIFEKGFTGYNGRMDQKATGIGLYLSKKILTKLSHKMNIESEVGVGTTVKIDFSLTEI